MDELDYRLLKMLKENARETVSNMSKEVHLSVSAVGERIRKMEESGIIQKYTIILDEKKMGIVPKILIGLFIVIVVAIIVFVVYKFV